MRTLLIAIALGSLATMGCTTPAALAPSDLAPADLAPADLASEADTAAGSKHAGDAEARHRAYDATADAEADVAAALARAQEAGKRVLVVLGANWCHDSRGFVEHLERPDIAALVDGAFEVVYVDVGSPQTGQARNLEIAERFGQSEVVGTPTVILLDDTGVRLNREDSATAWRNAHSRSPVAVLEELKVYAEWQPCYPMPVSMGEGQPLVAPDCSGHTRP